ncbi:MAG: hypothetical protein D6798_18330 [Deltaproteobacteria bacterium]|nr:MAG: hypothetical protein D6798_18330 [Deltaproteobacteria bacterium]
MSRRRRGERLARIAILLWLPVAGGLLWLGLRPPQGGATGVVAKVRGDDGRQVITVNAADAGIISRVMRDNLAGLRAIEQALAEGDMAAVSRAAETWAATPGPARQSVTLEQQLPRQWRSMGFSLHETLRQLADDARRPDVQAETVAAHLADAVGACIACHETYRLVVAPGESGPRPP